MFFSIIVPVYNRPDEIDELLESLCHQKWKEFEVVIIEDGSTRTCRHITDQYNHRLNITYIYKENSGQGFSRNLGFQQASGDYLIVFDSDCLVPPEYLEYVADYLNSNPGVDAWGGPDRSHPNFSDIQKAISYAMTSPLTTGGIRGSRKRIGEFVPRSFNMGISREVYQKTGGYLITRKGEDLEFSHRIRKSGFRIDLIPEAYIYHKRRTDFLRFFRQLHFFGRARIHLLNFHPEQLKPVYLLPSAATLLTIAMAVATIFGVWQTLFYWSTAALYLTAILVDSTLRERSFKVGFLAVIASSIQIVAYGSGVIREWLSRS